MGQGQWSPESWSKVRLRLMILADGLTSMSSCFINYGIRLKNICVRTTEQMFSQDPKVKFYPFQFKQGDLLGFALYSVSRLKYKPLLTDGTI